MNDGVVFEVGVDVGQGEDEFVVSVLKGGHWVFQKRAPKGSAHAGQWQAAELAAAQAGLALPPNYDPAVHGAFDPAKAGKGQAKSALFGHGVPAGGFTGAKPGHAPPPPPPPDTKDLHYDHAAGAWKPERAALHQALIDQVVAESQDRELQPLYDAFDRSRPAAVFLVGGPASGKSSYKAERLMPHHRFVDIDCDRFKESLPEYSDANPGHVHKESVAIAKEALRQCLRQGRSFVYDSTGIDVQTIEKAAREARADGYHIALHSLHCHPEAAVERAAARKRKVPEHIVRTKTKEAKWAFGRLKDLADHVTVTNTTTPEELARHAG